MTERIVRLAELLPGQTERAFDEETAPGVVVRSATPGSPERAYLALMKDPVIDRLERGEITPDDVFVHLLDEREIEDLAAKFPDGMRSHRGHSFADYVLILR